MTKSLKKSKKVNEIEKNERDQKGVSEEAIFDQRSEGRGEGLHWENWVKKMCKSLLSPESNKASVTGGNKEGAVIAMESERWGLG